MRQRRRSRGFTVTELMIALTIIGILMAVALPAYFTFIQSTRAAQAVADLQAVRAAVYLFYGDTDRVYGDLGRWPRDVPPGAIPVGLQRNLPKNFSFHGKGYTLDYDNWIPLHRLGKAPPGTTMAVGIAVVSDNPRFLERVAGLIRDATVEKISPTKYTLVIATMDGF